MLPALQNLTAEQRIALGAGVVFGLDQLTKLVVLRFLGLEQEHDVIPGFFKFVHWGNTGAAWSLFRGNNYTLAGVSVIAIIVLFFARKHFDNGSPLGQTALGLMFGGIVGNLIDRLAIGHVVDFLYFHVYTRSGEEVGFPAFNIADSAICIGVGILFLLSWRQQPGAAQPEPAAPQPAPADPGNPPNPS
jgi:signal peptidase II